MKRNIRVFVFSCLLATPVLFGAAPAHCENKDLAGLPNFGSVSAMLFRGAQPSATGFSILKRMGVGMVVNFREEPDETAKEKSEVESLGMKYVGIPWSGRDNPSNAQIVQFLDLVRANPQTKVFVHCQAGADRTGTMIAAYRIAVEHKGVEEALKEMYSFHYHHFWLPQLERYVESLPHLLTADAVFNAYAPVLAPAAATATAAASVAAPAFAAPVFAPTVAAPVATPMSAAVATQ